MNRQHHNGFTILEIVITLVILSVALLGLGGLQTTAIQGANASLSRTTATLIAQEMSERIRANPAGIANGNYNNLDSSTATNPGCISSGCSTSAAVAMTDLYEIRGYFENLTNRAGFVPRLPSGRLTVVTNGVGHLILTVRWLEQNTTTPKQFITEFQP